MAALASMLNANLQGRQKSKTEIFVFLLLPLTHTYTHSHSYSHTHTHTYSHSLTYTHTHSLTHTLSFFLGVIPGSSDKVKGPRVTERTIAEIDILTAAKHNLNQLAQHQQNEQCNSTAAKENQPNCGLKGCLFRKRCHRLGRDRAFLTMTGCLFCGWMA